MTQQDQLHTVGLTQPTIYRLDLRKGYPLFIVVFKLPFILAYQFALPSCAIIYLDLWLKIAQNGLIFL